MKPEPIGKLFDSVVMIDRESRSVIIASEDLPAIKFSIDHPFIQGSKVEREARAILDAE